VFQKIYLSTSSIISFSNSITNKFLGASNLCIPFSQERMVKVYHCCPLPYTSNMV